MGEERIVIGVGVLYSNVSSPSPQLCVKEGMGASDFNGASVFYPEMMGGGGIMSPTGSEVGGGAGSFP